MCGDTHSVRGRALQGQIYRQIRVARPLPGGRLRQINDRGALRRLQNPAYSLTFYYNGTPALMQVSRFFFDPEGVLSQFEDVGDGAFLGFGDGL